MPPQSSTSSALISLGANIKPEAHDFINMSVEDICALRVEDIFAELNMDWQKINTVLLKVIQKDRKFARRLIDKLEIELSLNPQHLLSIDPRYIHFFDSAIISNALLSLENEAQTKFISRMRVGNKIKQIPQSDWDEYYAKVLTSFVEQKPTFLGLLQLEEIVLTRRDVAIRALSTSELDQTKKEQIIHDLAVHKVGNRQSRGNEAIRIEEKLLHKLLDKEAMSQSNTEQPIIRTTPNRK